MLPLRWHKLRAAEMQPTRQAGQPLPHTSPPTPRAMPQPGPGLAPRPAPRPARGQPWKLYLLLLVCIAPVVASYLAYYVFPPTERTNYGTLIEPQRPVPEIPAMRLHPPVDGPAEGPSPDGLAALKGRWILLAIDKAACDLPCAEKLFFMRQTHVSLGKERDRMVRVLLTIDQDTPAAAILAAHPDMVVLRVRQADLDTLFPVEAGGTLSDHIYLVDPLHNLMMRFPKNPDPAKTRKDLQKLMKASRIG